MMFAKIATARKFLLGPILDTDGVAKTDEVVASIKVTKNGTVGTVDAQSTLAHSHTGHYVFDAVDGGDFDTTGEVEFSLNSTTNAMAPVKFQVLPAVNFDALFATAPGAATGLMIAGSNAATTFANLTVSGTSALGAVTATTIAASGAVTAASLTMSGALQAATIVSTGTTTLNSLVIIGTTTLQGAVGMGAVTFASMAVTGALSVGTTTTLTGAVSCGSTFDVVGALTAGSVSIDATMDVVGALTCASFGVDGAVSVGTTTTLTGAVSLGATLGVTGTTTLAAITQTGAVSLGATTFATLTVTGATTLTGNVAAAAGITVTQSTEDGHGIVCTGNGLGSGLRCIAGASGHGINASASGAAGQGIRAYAGGLSGDGIFAYCEGANGAGIIATGRAQGIYAYSPSGPGMEVIGATADIKGDILGNITGNLVGTVSTVTTLTGHTAQTGDSFARIGALGASLTGIPWNSAWDAEAESECNDALVALHLDHLLAVDYDPASKPGTATALLNELVESDSGVSRFTVNALEQGPSGTGASAETIADAVWDEVGTGHTDAGKAGQQLWTDVDAILEDTGTTLDGRIPTALVTGRMSSDAVAISGSTSAADKLELSALSIETGAAAAGTLSTTKMTSTLTEATDDHYIGRIIIWTSGVLIRQTSDITDYVGSGGLLTFTAVTEAPTAGDTFIIV